MKLLSLLLSQERFVTFLIGFPFVLAVLLIYPKWQKQKNIQRLMRQHGCEDPPTYPHTDRVLGSDLALLRASAMAEGCLFPLYLSQFEKYGKTFEENWKGMRLINTMDPINIQHIATVGLNDYCKDPGRVTAQSPFLGQSIFSDGPHWKSSRALLIPIFNKAELSDLDHLASFTDRFIDLIPRDGSTIDIQPLLIRLFLDVAMDFLFGKSIDSLQPNPRPECTEFTQAFDMAQRWVTKRRENPWQCFFYSFNKEWIGSYSVVHKFVDEQVQRALSQTKFQDKADVEEPPARKRYIVLDEMAKQIRDPIQLRYQVLGAFLPARDTTARAVANSIFELARHPDIWGKLRRVSLALGDKPITLDVIRSLTDFKHVVLETIRLIGPAARVWRFAACDTVLPTGGGSDRKSPIFVPKGTRVVLGTWCIHHDKDFWGSDWDQFKPDRWIGRQTRWEFVPFLGGPRRCPAQQQVMTHTIYMLVRLTQTFESIENRDPVLEYVEKYTMGHSNKTGVQVAFK